MQTLLQVAGFYFVLYTRPFDQQIVVVFLSQIMRRKKLRECWMFIAIFAAWRKEKRAYLCVRARK